jgi:AcrR family transcriptional regulator
MKTPDKIIDAAIELFNQRGTKNVTTNHIAAAIGISPGNLYYHFRNKQDIIRAIFEQMDAYGLDQYLQIASSAQPGSLELLERTFVMIQEYNWRYRFFKRELTALVMDDPVLQERFQQTNKAMLGVIRQANEQAIAAGSLKPMDEAQMALFCEAIWLVALFWPNYLEVSGELVNEASLRRGIDLLRIIILPYLNAQNPSVCRE